MCLSSIREQFHQSMHVTLPIVSMPTTLPSPICRDPIPSRVAPSIDATPSLFPSSSFFHFLFMKFSCYVVSSLPLMPKLTSAQVGLLWTCSFVLPLHYWKSLSCLCHAPICLHMLLLLLVLSSILLQATSLAIPQWCLPIHWAWRSCEDISTGLPKPNDMPHGSAEIALSRNDPSQSNVGHMDWSLYCRKETSLTLLFQHLHASYFVSCTTWSIMED